MIFNKPFGRYRLIKKIAMGGMAEVFLAIKRGPGPFDKLVALKCILPHVNDDPRHVEMFYREARIGGLFTHSNTITVYDAETIEGRHCMSMEFVPGHTVEDLVARAGDDGIAPRHALAIVADAALGLHHAHNIRDIDGEPLGLVHRDVSPHNILVGYDGLVRVFDFGVAVGAGDDGGGELAGKTAYMSPEQCRGKKIDARADVFALGIVLHELMTGRRLFKRDNHMQTLRAITEEAVPRPSELRAGVPPEIDQIVMRALERSPARRYASALELHHDLLRLATRAESIVDAPELAALMERHFRDDIDELRIAIGKSLMAPEHTDATIDLSTFDVRTSRQQAVAPGPAGRILTEEGAGLEELAATRRAPDSGDIAAPEAAPVLGAQASQAVVEQLRRARAAVRVLGAVAALLVIGLVVSFLLPRESAEPIAAPVPVEAPAETRAVVDVRSTPAGARVLVDGAVRAESTPAELVLTAGDAVAVTLELEGYLPFEQTVTPPEDGSVVTLDAALEVDVESPVAPIGSVRVTYQPTDATAFLDGEPVGEASPLMLDGLRLNTEHTLRLESDGYVTLHHPIEVDSAELLEIQLSMAEAVALGTWNIHSDPDGATVLIDGEEIGETPLDGLELLADRAYTVEVRRWGYYRWRRQMQVRADVIETIEAELIRIEEDDDEPAPQAGAPAGQPQATPGAGTAGTASAPAAPEPEPEPEPEDEGPRYQLLD